MTKDCPRSSCIVLKRNSTVTRYRPLIDVLYKYKEQEVLSFIPTYNVSGTKAGILYLSKYPDLFYNVSNHPSACSIIMSKLFVSINEVDPHNKPRHSDLELEKYWVNH